METNKTVEQWKYQLQQKLKVKLITRIMEGAEEHSIKSVMKCIFFKVINADYRKHGRASENKTTDMSINLFRNSVELMKIFLLNTRKTIKERRNGFFIRRNCFMFDKTHHSGYVYDAVWLYALALERLVQEDETYLQNLHSNRLEFPNSSYSEGGCSSDFRIYLHM